MVVFWTKTAASNLQKICSYIALDSSYYAQKVKNDIIQAVDYLSLYPHHGRFLTETKRKDIREILVYSYRILYRVSSDKIYILRLLNTRQKRRKSDYRHPGFS